MSREGPVKKRGPVNANRGSSLGGVKDRQGVSRQCGAFWELLLQLWWFCLCIKHIMKGCIFLYLMVYE